MTNTVRVIKMMAQIVYRLWRDGHARLVFHAWNAQHVGYENGGYRQVLTTGLSVVDAYSEGHLRYRQLSLLLWQP